MIECLLTVIFDCLEHVLRRQIQCLQTILNTSISSTYCTECSKKKEIFITVLLFEVSLTA